MDPAAPSGMVVCVFMALQLTGCFAFAFMLFSALVFPSVKRHPIWYNFCLSWIIFSLSYCLLAFTRQQETPAARNACIAQAVMVYAAPFLAGAASLSMVALLLTNILSALSGTLKKRYPLTLVLAMTGPWVLWLGVLTGGIVFVINNRGLVSLSENRTYCVVTGSPIPRLTAIAAAVFAVSILVLETIILRLLYKNRALSVFNQSISMACRVLVFTVVALIAGVVGLIFASTARRGVVFDVMIAIVPCAAFVIFGTQLDLWEGYLFWRRSASRSHDETSQLTTIAMMSIVSESATSAGIGSASSSNARR